MSDAFFRRDTADITKKLDADLLQKNGLEVYQLRMQAQGIPAITRLDAVLDTLYYIGQAPPGSLAIDPVWTIRQMVISGANVVVLWAEGSSEANKVWNDRASYSYS